MSILLGIKLGGRHDTCLPFLLGWYIFLDFQVLRHFLAQEAGSEDYRWVMLKSFSVDTKVENKLLICQDYMMYVWKCYFDVRLLLMGTLNDQFKWIDKLVHEIFLDFADETVVSTGRPGLNLKWLIWSFTEIKLLFISNRSIYRFLAHLIHRIQMCYCCQKLEIWPFFWIRPLSTILAASFHSSCGLFPEWGNLIGLERSHDTSGVERGHQNSGKRPNSASFAPGLLPEVMWSL